MCEGLVDREPHIVKSTNLHNDLPPVVKESVEGGIADHLVHLDDGLMRHVVPGHVVAIHAYVLIRTCL